LLNCWKFWKTGYHNVVRQWSGHLVGHLYLVYFGVRQGFVLSPVLFAV